MNTPELPFRRLRLPLAAAVSAMCALAAFESQAASSDSYRLERAVPIRSTNTGWDYNALDEQRGRMFIAHRKDGLQVFDVRKGRLLATLRDSTGANTSALAPEFDLGISGTTDGHVIVFKLSSLQTVARYKSRTDGFDGATYDPTSKRFAIVGEADKDRHVTPVLFFDGRNGQPVGSVEVPSEKVDAPRPDAAGHLYLPLRDKGAVARLDAQALALEATWPLSDCLTPASLDVDAAQQRVFVACRGKGASEPALAVIDAASGRQVTKLPIGRGVDDVFYDRKNKSIITVNGDDATLTLISQRSADSYALAQTISTRPMARTGVFDAVTGRIHLVTAEFVRMHDADGKAVTTFLPNTFNVLTYGRAALSAGSDED